MRHVLLLTIMVVSLSVGQSQEPPEYPVGVSCSPKGDVVRGRQTTDHPCACKRHDDVDADDPDAAAKGRMCQAGEATNPSHDAVCKQWCHEQHCSCPIACHTAH